jgi:ABC-type Fe3+/spermidine/putrescine transport system ATPase subunit
VALARALITQPEVLLMDEPFGALDKKLRESMQLEIKNVLRKLNITAIFVTHDQEEALVLSDRVVVMNNGTIEQIGPPENLYEKPKTHFVANFIGVSNIFRGMVHQDKEKYIDLNGKKLLLGEAAAGEGIFALRPEKLKLSPDRIDEENCFEGIVENVKYFGMASQYYIDIGLGEPVIANCQNTGEGGQAYHVGDKVYVAIDKRNILQVN